jgi:hypothetical protein
MEAMRMFDSDLRRRVGVFLAWLALVALGAGGLVRDAPAPARLVDQTAAAIAGAPYDGGHPFVRAGGLTLSAHYRAGEDDRHPVGGDPAKLSAAPPALPAVGLFRPDFGRVAAGWTRSAAATPYSARAPPMFAI